VADVETRVDPGTPDRDRDASRRKYYTRPFGFKTTLTLQPDTDWLEYVCTENWKNRAK
jgi:hypothetical protein